MMHEVHNPLEFERVLREAKEGDCILLLLDGKERFMKAFNVPNSDREDWSGVCC